jgi:uncharacterized membrane-anchored protein
MKLKLLILILGLQMAWIVGTTFVQERALTHGKVVLLETRPVDPRDLLRGDYLILNYKISDVPLSLFMPTQTNGLPPGQTVYVALEPRGQFHEVVRASTEPIEPAAEYIVLKGRTQTWWGGNGRTNAHLEYGLERYYVREGTGNPHGKITVQVAIPASGQGSIKQVFLDGKPYAEAMTGVAR